MNRHHVAMTMKHFVARMSEATSGKKRDADPDFASLIRATGLPIQFSNSQDVDARHKAGHDERKAPTRYDPAFSRRDAPEVLQEPFAPRSTEGAGKAGWPMHPQPRVRNKQSTRA